MSDRICPLCGLPVAFIDRGDDPKRPTCNPLRSPDCWTITARLKDGKQYPVGSDLRADPEARVSSRQTQTQGERGCKTSLDGRRPIDCVCETPNAMQSWAVSGNTTTCMHCKRVLT